MKRETLAASALDERAAAHVAAVLGDAIAARGRAGVAFSGGGTATSLFTALVDQPVDWSRVAVWQVDERIAPAGHPERNLTALRAQLVDRVGLPDTQLHPMPVADDDLDAAAERYGEQLRAVAGDPPRLDLVHLGLGADGHTASLVPGSPLLEHAPGPVAVTGIYQGRRRMTLTLPVLSGARNVLWFVRGADKADAVRQLVDGDVSVPAARVARERALLLLDPAAAGELSV
ncbi:MAG: 6-phosphogluconolactonase [Nitriliruptoraceae bacterium]|nr:6-phosphogluconolactonase [Nitriliruptoraceae bacterium]